ncbi:MAG: metallophosphoesterase [Alphaproteobacteria bacterium]
MQIRIISDLHLDFNEDYELNLKNKDVFTIICGDTSAYFEKTTQWLSNNVKQGVFVAGNHIFYNESKNPLQHYLKQLEERYTINSELSFLNNSHKVIDDFVFVGGILWTDYELYGVADKYRAKKVAEKNMNDFRYGRVSIENDNTKTKQLTPNICENMFNETLKYIENICKRYPNKKIVVVTHHAPSMMSISSIYKDDVLSASFASNLDNFIIKHPNIKLWCHGHIHTPSDYTIGNCRIICNPRGYIRYNENPKFNSEFIIEV